MATDLFDLTGKIALVSGASRGIGEEIAKLLALQGAHVIVSSRKIDDCTAVAETIREQDDRWLCCLPSQRTGKVWPTCHWMLHLHYELQWQVCFHH